MDYPFSILLGRVYIGCNDHDFDKNLKCSSQEFLNALLYSCPKKYIIKNDNCEQKRVGRVREEIKDIANQYVRATDIKKANTNVFSYVSKNQYNHLINSFDINTSSISCFSLVILMAAFDLLVKNGKKKQAKRMILRYVEYIHTAVVNSSENTEVSQYLLDCYLPVRMYISSDGTIAPQLPAIPKILIADPDMDK